MFEPIQPYMRFSFVFYMLVLTGTAATAAPVAARSYPSYNLRHATDTARPGNTRAARWTVFWNTFNAAINAKDTAAISRSTSGDFYDGGGGTVVQWLQTEVFATEKTLTAFRQKLRKGVKNFKCYEGHPCKATGRNTSGDLFFEYTNGGWLFGGLVGD
ncbi:MAG: hypothetical protein ABIU63_16695 [Chitinophagaceae bacterium]